MNCRRTLDDSPTGTLECVLGGGGMRSRELRKEWGAKWGGSGRERVNDKVGHNSLYKCTLYSDKPLQLHMYQIL